MIRSAIVVFVCGFCACSGERLVAQQPEGYVSVGVDALPNVAGDPFEIRARLFLDEQVTPFEHLRLRAAGALDLLGIRNFGRDEFQFLPPSDEGTSTQDLQFVPTELYGEVTGVRGDVRIGYSRIVWGRLDEVQPTDVVNPLDLARFFFEGRTEARLAVPMARGRLFFDERASVEAIVVPQFRRGRFDLLDEPSSPFNVERGTATLPRVTAALPRVTATLPNRGVAKNGPILATTSVAVPVFSLSPPAISEAVPLSAAVPVSREEPAVTWGNVQGGARLSATTGRVDWSLAFFRGFEPFGAYLPAGVAVRQVFPRYTMIGGDFETTKGEWALRGEAAYFASELDSVDAGIGFDRRAGPFHVSGTVLVHHEAAECVSQEACAAGPAEAYTAASLVVAADRSFARERYRTRTFAVYNATEREIFLRNITSMEVRANVTLEGSIGWFFGTASSNARRDVIGRFSDRDFLFARLRLHF